MASRGARHGSHILSDGNDDTARKRRRLRDEEEKDKGQRKENLVGLGRAACPSLRPRAGLGAELAGRGKAKGRHGVCTSCLQFPMQRFI